MTDELICPFCGAANQCMVNSEQPCWCIDVQVPASLIELLPNEFKNKSCICAQCINLYNRDIKSFKARYLE